MNVSSNYGAELSSLWPPSLLPLPGLYSCCDINWNLMKPLAAPVIIASKEHHLLRHYIIIIRGDGGPSLFSERVKCRIESLLSLSTINPSISIISDITILWPIPLGPSLLRFRGCDQPCSGSGEGWGLRLRSHATTDTKSISPSARWKLPLSPTCAWSLPSVVIGMSFQDPITFCRDTHKLFRNIFNLMTSKMAGHILIFCLTTFTEALSDHWLK